TGADASPAEGRTAGDQQPHGQRRSVPAAGRQPSEQAGFGGGLVQMKRLWIELPRESLDVLGRQFRRSMDERLANGQILQVNLVAHGILRAGISGVSPSRIATAAAVQPA